MLDVKNAISLISKEEHMAFKRVPLYFGDTVQLCFVPPGEPQTLMTFDEVVHARDKTSIFLKTNTKGFPLCLNKDFLVHHSSYGDHQIGLVSGDELIGGFTFETIKEAQSSATEKQNTKENIKALSFRVEALEHALLQVQQLASRDSELFGANRKDIVERVKETLEQKI
jgi:hypothetical protein